MANEFKKHIRFKNRLLIFLLKSIIALLLLATLSISEQDVTIPLPDLSIPPIERDYTDYLNLTSQLTLRGGYFRSSYNISHTVFLARQKILSRENGRESLANTSATLGAVMILSTGFNDDTRVNLLKCSLFLLYTYVGQRTALEVYLFVPQHQVNHAPKWLSDRFPQVVVLPLSIKDSGFYRAGYTSHSGLGNNATWIRRHQFSYEYYMMGRWRLTFMFDFLREMGHRYLLQLDDDTFVKQAPSFDLVQEFLSRKVAMAVWRNVEVDPDDVLLGLTEFSSYWMKTRGMQTPRGVLLEHLKGGSYSSESWDRAYYRGCFFVCSVDFWFDAAVQDYLQLLFKTGSDIEQRWQDQAVENMLRLIFLKEEEVHVFKDIDIIHGKVGHRAMRSWGCQL